MNVTEETIGSLNCKCMFAPHATMGVVLWHGYGANANDLLSLVRELQPGLPEFSWILPEGILDLGGFPGNAARAWFPVDHSAVEQAMARGEYRDRRHVTPDGLGEAAERSRVFLEALVHTWRFDRIIIGGFSQGAMVATELALNLTAPLWPAGLIVLSGTLLHMNKWARQLRQQSARPFFQSHGRHDPLLNPAHARELHSLLQGAGWTGELLEFAGGHEIPPSIVQALTNWLRNQL